jgi:hypothetical protein
MIPKKIKKESTFQDIIFGIVLGVLFFGLAGFLIVSNINIEKKRGDLLKKIDDLKNKVFSFKPDMIAFSFYATNIEMQRELL